MGIAYQPHSYELTGIKFLVSRPCAGLFWDPGMGKTSVVLAAFETLRRKRIVSRMLVVAPLRPAYSVWPGEIQKWQDFQHLKVAVLHGPNKLSLLHSDADVMVINPEGLKWLSAQRPLPDWEMLVVDESTRFKHTTTERFKFLKPMLPRFARRVILTGSPAPNGLLDLFGQVYILDFGNSLGQYISHYRANYFDNPRTGSDYDKYVWIPRTGAPDAIYKKIQPLVQRMDATDHLDLPDLVFNTVTVELPPEARKHYDQMESMLLTAVEEGVVTAANAGAAMSKCRQIANGGIYHEDGEKWSQIHDAKTDAVEEIIEELSGKPALVAYEYRHDLERLRKRLGADIPYIGGGVPPSRFREIEEAWNRGQLPVLLAQPQSVAHGLNLQGTSAAIIRSSLTYDLEVDEQFIRRVWRQGQKGTVFVHSVVAKNTVDEVILTTLKQKDRTQKNLLNALKAHLKEKEK